MKLFLKILGIALSTAALLATGMAGGGGSSSPLGLSSSQAAGKQTGLVGFRNCNRLSSYLWRHRSGAGAGLPQESLPGASGDAAEGKPAAPTSETGTNVQEAGIDEPDTVKSAQSAILALADGDLHAVVTGPDGPVVADTLEVSGDGGSGGGEIAPADIADIAYSGGPTSILVHGDVALVVGYGWDDEGEKTTLTVVDISDPSALSVTKTMEADGYFVDGRQSGSVARLAISAYADTAELRRHRGSPRRWLPSLRMKDGNPASPAKRRLASCTQVERARRYSGSGMLTVLTVDLAGGAEVLDSDAILTGGDTVYASADRMYVATQRWAYGSGGEERASEVSTQIHAFDTSEPAATEYAASGRVPGWMLSQWSMSERDGVLRVASTTVPPWEAGGPAGESESFVTVLAERGGELVRNGQLGGLGADEQIYAVRFFDDVGYLVTFRQVDPLYAIDLSDPAGPRLAGELKIPGYSAYLHPVGEGLLLGVGQDADAEGVTQGAQLSLFDVSDLSSPARIDTQSLGRNAYTDVEWDHHAFFHDPATGTAITPVSDYGGGEEFYGAVGTRISADGLTEIARLRHGDRYGSAITRSLSRDGSVYTVSGRGVMRHDPDSLAPSGFAAFP